MLGNREPQTQYILLLNILNCDSHDFLGIQLSIASIWILICCFSESCYLNQARVCCSDSPTDVISFLFRL